MNSDVRVTEVMTERRTYRKVLYGEKVGRWRV